MSFNQRPLYSQGKPLDKRLDGPQNRSGRREEQKNLAHTGTRTLTPRPIAKPPAVSRVSLYVYMETVK